MAMTQAAFKARVAELAEVGKKDVDNFFEALEIAAQEVVENVQRVTIPGIGRLSCNLRNARTARNPRTGDPVKVPAKVGVRLSPVKSLKEAVPSVKKAQSLMEKEEANKKSRSKASSTKKSGTGTGKRGRPPGSKNKTGATKAGATKKRKRA